MRTYLYRKFSRYFRKEIRAEIKLSRAEMMPPPDRFEYKGKKLKNMTKTDCRGLILTWIESDIETWGAMVLLLRNMLLRPGARHLFLSKLSKAEMVQLRQDINEYLRGTQKEKANDD